MRRLIVIAFFFFSAAPQASAEDLLCAIEQVAKEGVPMETLAYNKPVHLVPVPGTNPSCAHVGVMYTAGKISAGPLRIDNYAVCDGAQPRLIHDVSPALPNDAPFQQLTKIAMRSALRTGSSRRTWHDYHVDTRRLSEVSSRGCALVETIISVRGLLVYYGSGRICQ